MKFTKITEKIRAKTSEKAKFISADTADGSPPNATNTKNTPRYETTPASRPFTSARFPSDSMNAQTPAAVSLIKTLKILTRSSLPAIVAIPARMSSIISVTIADAAREIIALNHILFFIPDIFLSFPK